MQMPTTTAAQQILRNGSDETPGIPAEYWELIEDHRGTLINQAFAILGKIEDAEDVVQETFCEAVRNPERLKQARSLSALLRTMNKANALNRLRMRRTDSRRMERAQSGRMKTYTTGGFSLVDMREALAKAIETLPPETHQVMVLRYWDRLSFKDIAQRLKLALTTVWRLHYEASEHLYKELNPGLLPPSKGDAGESKESSR